MLKSKNFLLYIFNLVLIFSFILFSTTPQVRADATFSFGKSMGGSGSDVGKGVFVDSSGNIYTTGYFNGTADFNPGAGTSNLTSVGSQDIFISKLDSSGNFLWAKSMGSTSVDQGLSITVDSSGNVYTTGYFRNTVDFDPGADTANLVSSGDLDIFISKLDSYGNFVWAKSIGSTTGEQGESISVDSSGNIYTIGSFTGTVDFDPGAGTSDLTSAGDQDVFISKLDSSGNFVWAKSIGSATGDQGFSLYLDNTGHIYTVVNFNGTVDFDPGAGTTDLTSVGGQDVAISKLDTDGVLIWAKSMGGTSTDLGYSVSVDSSGNVYSTGYFQDTVDFDPGAGTSNLTAVGLQDIFISKLDSSGNFLWAKSIGSTSTDIGYSVSVDSSGNVYSTGYFQGTADFDPGDGTSNLTALASQDLFISKLDTEGLFIWAKSIGGTSLDFGNSIYVDSSNNIYTTGSYRGTVDFDPGVNVSNLVSISSGADIFISKLSQQLLLTEVTPIGVVVNNNTPSYTFNSNTAGTITYGGSCSSATTTATVGDNIITLNTLPQGTYNNCTITVTNNLSVASNVLSISSFDLVVHSGGGGGGSTPTPTEPTPTPEISVTPTSTEPITPIVENPIPEIVPVPEVIEVVPVVCNQGEIYNANTGETCTSFVPVVVEPILESKIIEKPKPIVKPKEIEIVPSVTEDIIPVVTETISTQGSANTESNTEPTIQETYSDVPLPVAEQENNSENVFEYINNQAKESFKETSVVVNTAIKKTREVLETEEGDTVSKVVTIGGTVAGTSSMVASIAFATPLSFSEIPLIPLRMWTLFLGFLGIKKRTRRWGVVYDSITKQPLDPAYVTLKNLEGQKVATTITDIDGRYGFAVNPGTYILSVNKTNYTFPSVKLAGRQADELYDSLYLGDMITISNPTDIIAKNIPLDLVNFSWNESEKEKRNLTTSFKQKDLIISKIFNFLFILGFLIALIALLVAPEPYNGIILALYLTIFIVKKVGIQTKNKGSVIEKATGLPLQNGIIRLFYADMGHEIAHALIDQYGKFYCLVQNGTYKIQIEKKNLDGSYIPVYQKGNITVTNGVLNMGFNV